MLLVLDITHIRKQLIPRVNHSSYPVLSKPIASKLFLASVLHSLMKRRDHCGTYIFSTVMLLQYLPLGDYAAC